MSKRMIQGILFIAVSVSLIYMLFIPLPNPELAIRRDLLIKSPSIALTGEVLEGKLKNDPLYGALYIVPEAELTFVYVKKNKLGWYVTSRGTGP